MPRMLPHKELSSLNVNSVEIEKPWSNPSLPTSAFLLWTDGDNDSVAGRSRLMSRNFLNAHGCAVGILKSIKEEVCAPFPS